MLRLIGLFFIILGLATGGAIVSLMFMGPDSPVAPMLARFLCGTGNELIVGDAVPVIPNTVSLACASPDSEFGVSLNGSIIQLALAAFSPVLLGIWLIRMGMRWKAAGDYMEQSSGASDGRTLAEKIGEINTLLASGQISKQEAAQRINALNVKK